MSDPSAPHTGVLSPAAPETRRSRRNRAQNRKDDTMSAMTDAAELFRTLTGRAPDGVWSAPGRVNLIGEHTDYNDGYVLPFAISQRTAAAAGLRDDRIIRVSSAFSDAPVEASIDDLDALFPTPEGNSPAVPEWAAYPLGVAWALRQAVAGDGLPKPDLLERGVDIVFASEVPVGAGLSSSAALEGAAAGALNDLWSTQLDAKQLARVGRRAENEAVGAPTGVMDQMAAMLGAADQALFIDCRTLDANLVPLGAADSGLEVLVIDTLVQHAHSTGGYRDRRDACERGAAALGAEALRDVSVNDLDRAAEILDDVTFRRVRHIVTENQRVLDTVRALREHGARAIGRFLVESHVSMRDDFEISVPELDTAVEAAVSGGAIGARMTGGGFGGAAIALVDSADLTRVAASVEAAFAEAGFTAPRIFTVVPSAGARRDSPA